MPAAWLRCMRAALVDCLRNKERPGTIKLAGTSAVGYK